MTNESLPDPPPYIVHRVEEKDVTVDWFFGPGHIGKKIGQGLLVLIGWFFDILPIVITVSALRHRNHPGHGWWSYQEGYLLWDITLLLLSILVVVFILGFLALHFRHRAIERRRYKTKNYHEEKLAQRLEIAQALFASKYGPAAARSQQKTVRIEPYSDLETYELRDRYHAYGVD